MGPEQALPTRRRTMPRMPSQGGGHKRALGEKKLRDGARIRGLERSGSLSHWLMTSAAPRSAMYLVLITGGPDESREIAVAIDRRSHTTHGSVDVIDCRSLGALARVISHPSWSSAANGTMHHSILAVTGGSCAQPARTGPVRAPAGGVARMLGGNSGLRIMASSWVPLFDPACAKDCSDQRLHHRLNVIHMVAG